MDKFLDSISKAAPPDSISPELEALWFDSKGQWEKAHELVQDEETKESAWVHAYLHRKQGDSANAMYWYRFAGKPFSKVSLEEEWREIAGKLLGVES